MAEDLTLTKVNPIRSFNFARLEETDEPYIKGFPIIFLTTPLLNLTKDNIEADSYFSYMANNERDILSLLSFGTSNSTTYKTTSPFIKVLTNKFKTMDAKDTTARTKTLNETFYGHKMLLPSSLIESINGDEFSVTYTENNDLIITKLHKIWVEYTERIRRGDFCPTKTAIDDRYIDYLSSLYYFILDFDCETIKYYAKYTGIVPLNVPYSSFSDSIGEQGNIVDLSINYSYSYKEDMDPAILLDFNYNSNKIENLVNLPNNEEDIKLLKADGMTSGIEEDINKSLSESGGYYYFSGADEEKDNFLSDLYKSFNNKSHAKIYMTKNNTADNKYQFRLKFF